MHKLINVSSLVEVALQRWAIASILVMSSKSRQAPRRRGLTLPKLINVSSLVEVALQRWAIASILFGVALLVALVFPGPGQAQENLPGAPSNPVAAGGPSQITLSWDDPDDDSITERQYYQAQVAILVDAEPAVDDYFGWSLAMDGDLAVVGAPGNELEFDIPGSAYVYARESGVWTQVADLTASDPDGGDRFGVSVAVDGDTIVVGAKRNGGEGLNAGAAYVFAKPDSGWADATETAKLTASDAAIYDTFGRSVAVSGDTIVVGAPSSDQAGSWSGAAYLFVKPDGGWVNATETAQLQASDAGEDQCFGQSVAADGDTVVVGVYTFCTPDYPSGTAYVFVRPSSGWTTTTETAQLTASNGHSLDEFGSPVAIDGDTIVVGAVLHDANGFGAGSVYVFVRPDSGWSSATETAQLHATDAKTNANFGFSAAISGDTIAVGSLRDPDDASDGGAVYVYVKPADGWDDVDETIKLTAYDTTNYNLLGYSTALDGNTLVSGAPVADHGGSRSGSAYSAQLDQWTPIPDSGQGDINGTSYTVTGLTNGQSYTFRVRAVNQVGPGPASDSVVATPQFLVTISVSDSTPLIGQRITLTADVASGIAVASYQWDRKFGDGTWREDGPPRKSKGVKFDVNRTAVYRAVVTLSTGRTIRSEPITLTWRVGSRITVSNSAPARGEPVIWTAQLRGGDCSSMDYAWYQVGVDGAGSSVEGASSDTITEMFFQAEPRTYYVEVTCSDSEGNGVTYTSDRVTATATDEIWPYASVTSDDDDNVVESGDVVELRANLERREPPLNWLVTWERRFGNGEWRDVGSGSGRKALKFDSPGSRTYRSSIYIIQLDETVKSEPITVTWTD